MKALGGAALSMPAVARGAKSPRTAKKNETAVVRLQARARGQLARQDTGDLRRAPQAPAPGRVFVPGTGGACGYGLQRGHPSCAAAFGSAYGGGAAAAYGPPGAAWPGSGCQPSYPLRAF